MILDGKTSSEACGITMEGDNKWITLIQNAKNNTLYHNEYILYQKLTKSKKTMKNEKEILENLEKNIRMEG